MANKSDHNSNRTRIDQYLPEVNRSELNVTLAEGAFNRHLTKDNTIHINGYVGEVPANALTSRRIVEIDPHVSAYQLEPVMVTEIGTEKTILTQSAFLSQLGLMGIDTDRLPTWGSTTKFNWVPPVNIDMLINYQDYYWRGDSSTATPQYFTIESVCNKATSKVESYRSVIASRATSHPITNVDVVNNKFTLSGLLGDQYIPGYRFKTVSTIDLNFVDAMWTVVSASIVGSSTVLEVEESIAIHSPTPPVDVPLGKWWYDTTTTVVYSWSGVSWDVTQTNVPLAASSNVAITIAGYNAFDNTITLINDAEDIFTPGYKFQTVGMSSTDVRQRNLLNSVWTVASVDTENGQTTVVLAEPLATVSATAPSTPSVGDWWADTTVHQTRAWTGTSWVLVPAVIIMDASLAYQLGIYESQANCACSNQQAGWDINGWDDNQVGNVLWSDAVLDSITFQTSTDWVNANGNPTVDSAWYDIVTDTLKRWSVDGEWVITIPEFSTTVDKLTGTNSWDASTNCATQPDTPWYRENKWIHKSQITSTVGLKRAAVPILEYNSTAEVNSWVRYDYNWNYRPDVSSPFASRESTPDRIELDPIKHFTAIATTNGWVFYLYDVQQQSIQNIDYTNTFAPGYQFRVTDDSNVSHICTVAQSVFRTTTLGDPLTVSNGSYVTVVNIVEPDYEGPVQGGDLLHTRLEPVLTSTGDAWRGYNVHWYVNLDTVQSYPCDAQPSAYDYKQVATSTIVDAVGEHNIAPTYQETTLAVDHDTFTLSPALTYLPGTPSSLFAVAGYQQLRVYVNGARQYGNYVETVATADYDYVMIGTNAYDHVDGLAPAFQYVTGIVFNAPISATSIVRLEVGTSARSDVGSVLLPVRTVASDAEFAAQLSQQDQPVMLSMPQFERREQQKRAVNQYPIFNLYDVVTGEVVKASSLFAYQELETNPINSATQTRITVLDGGREYAFEQSMTDGNSILAYRLLQLRPFTWYSPLTNTLQFWNGEYYDTQFTSITSSGTQVISTVVSSNTAPVELNTVDGSTWFDPLHTTLFVRNVTLGEWESVSIADVVVSDSDPMLQTIWKRGLNDEQYVPSYVDAQRIPTPVTNPAGSWETLSQWYYNSEHDNREVVTLSQLVTHFSSILTSQADIPALQGGGVYGYTQNEINAGLGGVIREHNYSFDLLISAVNNSLTSPIKILEFARDQYENSLLTISQLMIELAPTILANVEPAGLSDLYDSLSNAIISKYEENDFSFRVFGDSLAYNAQTGKGIRNWIATAPMLGFTPASQPLLLTNNENYTELLHHDGHRSIVKLSLTAHDALANTIISAKDSTGQAVGVSSASLPPDLYTNLDQYYTGTYVGKFWYTSTFGTRTLYQLQAYAMTDVAPAIVSGMVDGVKYYNTDSNLTYVLSAGAWVQTADLEGSLAGLWTVVDLSAVLGNVLLEVETRLFEVAQDAPTKQSSFEIQPADQPLYEKYRYNQFVSYLHNNNVTAPYVNQSFNMTNAFTWNYAFSSISLLPRPSVAQYQPYSSWEALYNFWYNTPVPHLEPWKLQGYTTKPTWWDEEYLNQDPLVSRRWKYVHATHTGMWENIRVGVIPAGREVPDVAVIPTYNYVPVNIDDIPTAATLGFAPDDLLPPYFNVALADTANDVRSVFSVYNTEIAAPDADYAFGFGSPVEWQWMTSAQYVYDMLIVQFLLEPVRFLHHTFGPDYVTVDGLRIDAEYRQVYTHKDITFHGDAISTTANAVVRGINQWYVNYNRYSGRDSGGTFNALWTKWTPLLAYQTNGISDTSTFEVTNKYFDITPQDYRVMLAKDGTVKDLWVDAFKVDILSMPPSIIQYNNQAAWKLSLSTLSPIERTIPVHGIKRYPFTVTPGDTTAVVYDYAMLSASPIGNWVSVANDQTAIFVVGTTVNINGSTGNDGTYAIQSAIYDPSTNKTNLVMIEPLVDASLGSISPARSALPWSTGDQVLVTSSKQLPQPLLSYAPYFIIAVDSTQFKLAETFSDALAGIAIDYSTLGTGIHYVGEAKSTFQAYGGAGASQDTWIHYAIDTAVVNQLTLPLTVTGVQQLIDIMDGYEAYQQTNDLVYSSGDVAEYDPTTGRLVGWHSEVERFIEWAYRLRSSNVRINDRYDVVVSNLATNEFSFTTSSPQWPTGTSVVLSTSGSMPTNVQTNTEYFIIKTGDNTFKLSWYKSTNPLGIVDVQSVGAGALFISIPSINRAYPSFEINPTRNQIVINTPLGVLANVISGNQSDLRIGQTLFDQYGRPLTADKIMVYRQDLQSRIAVMAELPNDVNPQTAGLEDPYGYLHLGGAHIFIEKYQHILVFNRDTISGAYMYDPFIGLNVKRFNLDYYETENYTLRPTIGGHFLEGTGFYRNIEGSISDIQTYYSAHDQINQNLTSRYSKALFDYSGNLSYLDALNVTANSQFAFYRGMIQTKGSVSSVNAYINSRRFVNAKIDEFWAWKLADFGDARLRQYPEIKLTAADGILGDIQLLFAADVEETSNAETLALADIGFEVVEPNSPTRFYNQPDQPTGLFLEVSSVESIKMYFGDAAPISSLPTTLRDVIWVNSQNYQVRRYNMSTEAWELATDLTVAIFGTSARVKLSQPTDAVRMVVRHPLYAHNVDSYNSKTINDDFGIFDRLSSEVIAIEVPTLYDGSPTIDLMVEIFALNPTTAMNNPARLYDTKTMTSPATIPMWDPARGAHYFNAIHNVDLLTADPAKYGVSLASDNLDQPWTSPEVGTMWVDSTKISYVPYYDDKTYPNVRDRLRKWGKLSNWAQVDAYVWTESNRHPDQWDSMVSSNTTLPNGKVASGQAATSVFGKVRPTVTGVSIVSPITVGDVEGYGRLRVPVGSFAVDDVLIITTNTTAITPNVEFTVTSVVNDPSNALFDWLTLIDDTDVRPILDVVTTGLVCVKGWKHYDWIKSTQLVQQVIPALLFADGIPEFTNTEVALSSNVGWMVGDLVDVYVNGTLTQAAQPINPSLLLPIYGPIGLADKVEVVKPLHVITDEERAISSNPDTGETLELWTDSYEYSTSVKLVNQTPVTYYYFWVKGGLDHDPSMRNDMSALDVMQQLTDNPAPYMVLQHPKDDPTQSLTNAYGYGMNEYGSSFSLPDVADVFNKIPVYYRAVILRNVAHKVTDDNRYVVQFTRDQTLRHHTNTAFGSMDLKNKHTEWLMIRKFQLSTIPRVLWDRAVESMIGYKLTNRDIRVPALDRELYDATYNTDTRYGLKDGQTFVNKDLAIATVLAFLRNPENSFYPIDVDTFLTTFNFDTPQNIEAAMNEIYNTFGTLIVNQIWFELLADAMTTKARHSELMKTSWISLHGIRILDVGGLFDD